MHRPGFKRGRSTGASAADGASVASAEGRDGTVSCPICGWSGTRFAPTGAINRPARCERCQSLERHRALYLYLRDETSIFSKPSRVLHFAPEACLEPLLAENQGLDYVTTDLERRDVGMRMDIQELLFRDDVFDWILCSHVLEHVPDDQAALRELRRVLRPDGTALLMVPILDRPYGRTHDDPTITDPEDRKRAYGQADHVRAYSHDFADRVRSAGFLVERIPYPRRLGEKAIAHWGLVAGEEIFVCRAAPEDGGQSAPSDTQEMDRSVVQTISPRDTMAQPERLGHYFDVGRSAIGIVNASLEQAGTTDPRRILDLPSGYGRVLRMLSAGFPRAEITASDTNLEALSFCAETFGVATARATEDPSELKLPGEYDLIWCGSLVTHMPPTRVEALLRRLSSALEPGGVLIFTTHGAVMEGLIARGSVRPAFAEGGAERMLAGYRSHNFGFEPYGHSADGSYGFSLCSEMWIQVIVDATPGIELADFTAGAWDGRQDAIICRSTRS